MAGRLKNYGLEHNKALSVLIDENPKEGTALSYSVSVFVSAHA